MIISPAGLPSRLEDVPPWQNAGVSCWVTPKRLFVCHLVRPRKAPVSGVHHMLTTSHNETCEPAQSFVTKNNGCLLEVFEPIAII